MVGQQKIGAVAENHTYTFLQLWPLTHTKEQIFE
jgi:hypothetical protein